MGELKPRRGRGRPETARAGPQRQGAPHAGTSARRWTEAEGEHVPGDRPTEEALRRTLRAGQTEAASAWPRGSQESRPAPPQPRTVGHARRPGMSRRNQVGAGGHPAEPAGLGAPGPGAVPGHVGAGPPRPLPRRETLASPERNRYITQLCRLAGGRQAPHSRRDVPCTKRSGTTWKTRLPEAARRAGGAARSRTGFVRTARRSRAMK